MHLCIIRKGPRFLKFSENYCNECLLHASIAKAGGVRRRTGGVRYFFGRCFPLTCIHSEGIIIPVNEKQDSYRQFL